MHSGIPLFPNYASQNVLLKFKAGRMYREDKMVYPDTRKGEVIIYQSHDLLMHFCWRDRKTGTLEIDIVVFPLEFVYKRVPECTTGRVYVLKFIYKKQHMFFWMQEPKTDKDEELCWHVNDLLNNPPMPRFVTLGSLSRLLVALKEHILTLEESENLHESHSCPIHGPDSEECEANKNVHPAHSTSEVEGGRPVPDETPFFKIIIINLDDDSTSSDDNASTEEIMSDDSDVFEDAVEDASIEVDESDIELGLPQAVSVYENAVENISIEDQETDKSDILKSLNDQNKLKGKISDRILPSLFTMEHLEPILISTAVAEKLQCYLPPVDIESESESPAVINLRDTLTSRHFEEAVEIFSTVFETGDLGSVLQQFDIGQSAVNAAHEADMEMFIKALEEKDNEKSDEYDVTERSNNID